jgi:hypothetical protein
MPDEPTENQSKSAGSDLLYKLGQIVGITSGIAAAMLWMLSIWDPASGFSFSYASFAVVLVMTLIAIFAVIASIKGHGTVLIVLFAISFFPIGLYVLAVPYWLRWVGLANLGFLVAALLIRWKAATR